jgi:hypothetical protein
VRQAGGHGEDEYPVAFHKCASREVIECFNQGLKVLIKGRHGKQNQVGAKCDMTPRGGVPRDRMSQVIRRYESCLWGKTLERLLGGAVVVLSACGLVDRFVPFATGRRTSVSGGLILRAVIRQVAIKMQVFGLC